MKKLIALLVIISLISVVLVEAPPYAANRKRHSDPPQLSIMLPRDGQTLVGDYVTVQVFSANTKIKQSPAKNRRGEGHLKITIGDNKPLLVYETTYRANIATLGEGEHSLIVELVQNDHSSFEPAVRKVQTFNLLRSAVKGGNQLKVKKIIHPARIYSAKRI